MQRFDKYVNLFVFVILVALVFQFNLSYNPFSASEEVISSITETVKKEEKLKKEIKEKSKEYYQAPDNAYIDKVWKKTPGRNGLEVDVEKSYKKMKENGEFDESLLVFREITPKVHLEDLPPSPIYRGHPEKDMVAFLINVSWGTEYIPDILQILHDRKVKASFFIEGKWAKENANLVKMIKEQGHTIGNHAYNHPDMARISKDEIYNQLSQTNDILKAITGEAPKWFAPPSGSYNQQVVEIAHNLDMETVLWTVDTIDWKNPAISVMINRVNNKIHPGATVLMHPTEAIRAGLNDLIDLMKEKGYRIGTIESLVSEDR